MKDETNFKKGIGKQIADLRAAAGLTQMDLAVKLDIHPNNVSYWERGLNLPNARFLEKICELFCVDLSFIKK
jgi:transcriptional regulator with XRE-family HTH domain